MTTPCANVDTINHIHSTLERMEKHQEKLVELMTAVAAQNVRLNHLEEQSERSYKDIEESFQRLRDVEMNEATSSPSRERITTRLDEIALSVAAMSKRLDKIHTFFHWTTHKYAIIAYAALVGMILFGTVLDIMYHKATVAAVVHLFGVTL